MIKFFKSIGVALAGNPAVIQIGLFIVAGFAFKIYVLPLLQKTFSDSFDRQLTALAEGLGVTKPESQVSGERTLSDDAAGLLFAQEGDRSLSDAVDLVQENPLLLSPIGALTGLSLLVKNIFFGDETQEPGTAASQDIIE